MTIQAFNNGDKVYIDKTRTIIIEGIRLHEGKEFLYLYTDEEADKAYKVHCNIIQSRLLKLNKPTLQISNDIFNLIGLKYYPFNNKIRSSHIKTIEIQNDIKLNNAEPKTICSIYSRNYAKFTIELKTYIDKLLNKKINLTELYRKDYEASKIFENFENIYLQDDINQLRKNIKQSIECCELEISSLTEYIKVIAKARRTNVKFVDKIKSLINI